MALVIILLAGLVYQNYSVNYQIREAEERMEKAQYENALTCLVKAEKLQPEDTGIPYMQAQCYYELGEADRAAEILENVVFKRSMDEERKIQYFDFIITILAGQQNYERISELLMESGDTAVQTQFQHYMAMKPEFGYSTGNYEKVISLKLLRIPREPFIIRPMAVSRRSTVWYIRRRFSWNRENTGLKLFS